MPDLTLIRPIPQELQDFLQHFRGSHIFCTIQNESVRHYPGSLEDYYQTLRKLNDTGAEVYFTVNASRTSRRLIPDMSHARAVFIDDDKPRDTHRTDFPIQPSIIVESSPGKYHYYWLTHTANLPEWKLVQKTLISMYNTDPAIHDYTRVLRLPTFKHRNGSICKVVENNGIKYEWTDIIAFFPPAIETSPTAKHAPSDFSLVKTISAFTTAESISPSLNSLIMHWAHRYSADVIKEQVQDLFDSLDQDTYQYHSKRYENARAQVDKFIRTAKAKTEKNVSNIHYIGPDAPIPQSVEWDWSLLKSNQIPEDAIPSCLLEAATEVGDWTAVGKEPAILSAIFITSALLSKNVLIHEIGDSLTTHCQCGIVVVMDTGARKSAIYEQMNKPFFEYEEQLVKEWEKTKHKSEAIVKLLDHQIKKLEQEFSKEKNKTMTEIMSNAEVIGELLERKESIQVKKPSLRSSDVTEEKLVRKLAENNGVIAILSDDARQVMSNLKGRYSKDTTGESVYINALTGSDILYERVGSDKEIHIKNPVLNALLFVQPDSAMGLKNSEMYVPSGLAARLPMYFYPVNGADIVRNTRRRVINLKKMNAYYSVLRSLCVRRFDNPLHVVISDAGMELCRKMDKEFADLLDNSWKHHYDKLNKIVTLTMMYATVFAALDDVEFRTILTNVNFPETTYTMPLRYLNMGFMFAKALFSHSIASYEGVSNEGIARQAVKVLEKLKDWYADGQIVDGFVDCGHLQNKFTAAIRPVLTDCLMLLLKKDWLYVTVWEEDPRKLNGGFLDKVVKPGDYVYHLNVKGIKKYDDMRLNSLEKALM